jgi:hypothetical protein
MGTCLYAERPSHSYGFTSSPAYSTEDGGRKARSALATACWRAWSTGVAATGAVMQAFYPLRREE